MKISDFKGKHAAALLCPLCENRFVLGAANGRWSCSQHKDTTITIYMDQENEFIRDVELKVKHSQYVCLWFDLERETTSYIFGQKFEDFNVLIDIEVEDYSLEEIKKIMFWA